MAGIGFALQKMLSQGTFFSTTKGFVYGAIISSGPWLLSIISVGILSGLCSVFDGIENRNLFQSIVIYTYASSMIITGVLNMTVTRYVADHLYAGNESILLPTFVSVSLVNGVLQGAFALFGLSILGLPFSLTIVAFLFYMITSHMWIVMIFLNCMRGYMQIFRGFLIGTLLGIVLGGIWGKFNGIFGILAGFSIGQAVIYMLLLKRILHETTFRGSCDFSFVQSLRTYPQLAFIGLLYACGLWSDKIMFWFFGPSSSVQGLLYTYPQYDTPLFIAYISIVPSLSLFIIRIETSFYKSYQNFYGAIVNKCSLAVMREKKQTMIQSLSLSVQRLLKFQGFITLLCIFSAHYFIDFLHLSIQQLSILRICFVGAFMQVLFLILTVIMLYFDFRNLCLFITALYFILTSSLTLVSINLGFAFYGYGYTLACFISVLVGFILFSRKLHDLEYITFMHQPIITQPPEQKEEIKLQV